MENSKPQEWSEVKKIKFHHRVKRFYHKDLFRKIYTVAIIGLIGANVFSLVKYYSVADEVPLQPNTQTTDTQQSSGDVVNVGGENEDVNLLSGGVDEALSGDVDDILSGGVDEVLSGDIDDALSGDVVEPSLEEDSQTPLEDENTFAEETSVVEQSVDIEDTNFVKESHAASSIMEGPSISSVSSLEKDTTQWVENEDFFPLDVKASDGETVLFTIMDRNLGATESGTICNSTNTGACGYYYQWGNNYGFTNQGTLTDIDTELVDITGEGYGPGKYYKSSTFINRTTSPFRWDADNSNETYQQYGNLNLWGGEKVSNPDIDRQGPCPAGYHVPDVLEWKAATETWCKEKMGQADGQCNNGYNFRDDLKLPFANYRTIYVQAYDQYGRYWSSSPSPSNAGNSYYFFFTSSSIYPQGDYRRVDGLSVRCFKDSQTTKTLTFDADNGEDNVVYNIRWWEPITKSHSFTPKKEGYKFVGWYNGDEEFNFSDSTFINESTVLTAKWEKYPWYTYDANGGKFADQSSQNVIKYGKTSESIELNVGQYGYKKIEGATKMRVELVNVGGCGTPVVYVYNYKKDNSTIGDDYIISGTQATLPSNIEIDGDTVGLVVTAYCGSNRTFNIIGESDYETSGVVTQPTREGYTFDGWYVIENETEVDFDPDADNEIKDTTIYARWKADKYTISFDTDGGNDIDPIEVEYNSVVDANSLPVAVKDCNDFLGWDGLVETMPAHDITLKAKYNYTCNSSRYSGGGGRRTSSSDSDSKVHGSADEKDSSKETENTSSDESVNFQSENSESQELDMQKYDDNYSKELNMAYQFAYKNGITTQSSIKNADIEGNLTRIQMAKMLSYYAINVLGKKPDYSKGVVNFRDVSSKLDAQYDNGVKLAYYLGIMGQNMPNNRFRPNDEVSRAEFVTALSRMAYGTSDGEYEATSKYYIHHMEKLVKEGIITKDDPNMKELRGYVMIMLMRSAES